MRKFFTSTAGFVAVIVVGLIVVAGGTATAAKLITSADIKNGTIQGKDMKAGTVTEKRLSQSVRKKLNAGGPQGPKGDPAPGGFIVNDGDGKSVSAVVSVEGDSFLRVVDGALWSFRWDGTLNNNAILFTELNCAGAPLAGVGSDGNPNPQRGVHGANAQGYRFANAAPQVRNFKSILAVDGGCDPVTGTQLSLELLPVNAPPALKGPLTVQANP